MSKSVFILWDEQSYANLHHEYIGSGEYKVVGDPIIVTKRARWSNDTTPEAIRAARAYAKECMQDGRANVRVEIRED